MTVQYWLFKSEPGAYSYDDLVSDTVAEWDGVRNYQARNLLRNTIQVGDGVLFYHSNTDPLAVIGTASVVRAGYPDHTAWDSSSDHPDPKSTPEKPVWYMVDIQADLRFQESVILEVMKKVSGLENMMLLRRGARLSIQPVTPQEWAIILSLGSAGA